MNAVCVWYLFIVLLRSYLSKIEQVDSNEARSALSQCQGRGSVLCLVFRKFINVETNNCSRRTLCSSQFLGERERERGKVIVRNQLGRSLS